MLLENWQDVVRHAWVTNLSVIFKFLVSVMGGMDLQRWHRRKQGAGAKHTAPCWAAQSWRC